MAGTPFKMKGFSGFGNSPMRDNGKPVVDQIRKGKLNTKISKVHVTNEQSDKITAEQQQARDEHQTQRQGNLLYLDYPASSWKTHKGGGLTATKKFRKTNPEASAVMDSVQTAHTLSFHGINPRTHKKYKDKKK